MRFDKILRTAAPALLLCANIFLFCPYTIYQGNLGEFGTSLSTILLDLLIPAGLSLILLAALGMALPDNLNRSYVSVLFMLGLLVWLQGNILVWKYGELNGQGIDWSRSAWRGWVDGTIWIGLMAAALLGRKRICGIASAVSLALLTLQCGFVVLTSVRNPHVWDKAATLDSPKKIFEFSARQNVIHIILDTFQADVFQAIIDEDPRVRSALEGFTFFKETTGPAPKTFLSLTALLSGQNYKNDIPFGTFANNVYQGKTITNVLYDHGYSIDTVGFAGGLKKGRPFNQYAIPRPYISEMQRPSGQSAAFLLDLALLRSVPHVFKKAIYQDQLWFVSRLLHRRVPKEMQASYFSETAFVRDLADHIVVVRNAPAYKYFHFMATHLPYIVNRDCAYAGRTLENNRESTTHQSRCFFGYLLEFLGKLRSSGIYDSSLIIIHGDHGTTWTPVRGQNMAVPLAGDAGQEDLFPIILGNVNPLLLVKPPFQKAPMVISHAQTELTDIPATVSAILDLREIFPGRSVYSVASNETRERKYYYHRLQPKKYFEALEEYVIRGPLLDRSSWRLAATYYSPLGPKGPKKEPSLRPPTLEWGSIIRFGRSGNAQPYLTGGWSAPEDGFTWTDGHLASLLIPSTPTRSSSVLLKASFAPFLAAGIVNKQTVNVLINGQKAVEWNITTGGIQELTLIVPKGLLGDADSFSITFDMPDAVSPKSIGLGKDRRILGIALRTLALEE
jgi:hypothetical protein